MYKIICDGETVGYSDTLVYIKLHQNGCYVQCGRDDAEGVCAKIASKISDDEGHDIFTVADTVFSLPNRSMHGDERTCTVEEMCGQLEIENLNQQIDDLIVEMLEGNA